MTDKNKAKDSWSTANDDSNHACSVTIVYNNHSHMNHNFHNNLFCFGSMITCYVLPASCLLDV